MALKINYYRHSSRRKYLKKIKQKRTRQAKAKLRDETFMNLNDFSVENNVDEENEQKKRYFTLCLLLQG